VSQANQPPLVVNSPTDPSVPPITVYHEITAAGIPLPVVPVGGNVQLEGTLNPAHSSELLTIPIGPATESLAISVRSAIAPSSGEIPVISRLILTNSDDGILAEWAANLSAGDGAPQSITVTFNNAPLGGHLLVQISTESVSYSTLTASVPATSLSMAAIEPPTAETSDRGAAAVTASEADTGSATVATPGTGSSIATASGSTSATATVSTSATATGSTFGTEAVPGATSATEAALSISATQDATGSGINLSVVNASVTNFGTWTATSPSPQSATWSVPFIVSVQLQVQSAPTLATTVPSQGQGTIGTFVVTPSGVSTFTSSALETHWTADASLTPAIFAPTVPGAVTIASVADQSPDLSDSFSERMPTGPFASRSASALGPIIASSMSDPTSPVDRHERALFQDMEGLGIQDGTTTLGRDTSLVEISGQESVRIEEEPQSSEMNDDDSLVVVVAGHGGFPLKATAPVTGGRGADLTALLAVLPGTSDSKTEIPVASSDDLVLDEMADSLAAATISSAVGRHEFPDYLRAACGLAIGLGFTSGPLFPDLMQPLRIRVPQWIGGRRGRASRGNG